MGATVTAATPYPYFEVAARASVGGAKEAYVLGTIGPSYLSVEQAAQWRWVNPGGDWVNRDGVSQGTANAHFSFAANSVTAGAARYTTSITAGAQAAFTRGRWNAYIVKCVGGTRSLATQRHPSLTAPRVDVTYTDGSVGALACTACVQLLAGTSYTRIGSNSDAAIDSSVALEFEMPAKAVSTATLSIAVTQHTAAAATISGYLANPPAAVSAVSTGVAASYPQDAGLKNDPSILFAQRFEDGTTLADYVIQSPRPVNTFDLRFWDPELFGTGPADATKLPTAHQGVPIAGTHKWIYAQDYIDTISLVPSSYTGDSFQPSAPGLGALRIIIPKVTAADGGVVGYSGSTGSDLWALFPKSIIGLISETYVRFRVRFAFTPKLLADTKMYRSDASTTAHYAIREGKWGMGTHHWTAYGGRNGVGGQNLGHTNRLGFRVNPADTPLMGLEASVHTYDMREMDMPFGQIGGLGAGFYPHRWYWIEIRKKLNTYNPNGAVGTSPADGVMEIYVDGRLAARYTGWKYRDGKLDYVNATPISSGQLVPFRQMGDIGLVLNMYNGGVRGADEDLVMFYAQIACGTRYIGLPAGA